MSYMCTQYTVTLRDSNEKSFFLFYNKLRQQRPLAIIHLQYWHFNKKREVKLIIIATIYNYWLKVSFTAHT